jgi:hypothetical protein
MYLTIDDEVRAVCNFFQPEITVAEAKETEATSATAILILKLHRVPDFAALARTLRLESRSLASILIQSRRILNELGPGSG